MIAGIQCYIVENGEKYIISVHVLKTYYISKGIYSPFSHTKRGKCFYLLQLARQIFLLTHSKRYVN